MQAPYPSQCVCVLIRHSESFAHADICSIKHSLTSTPSLTICLHLTMFMCIIVHVADFVASGRWLQSTGWFGQQVHPLEYIDDKNLPDYMPFRTFVKVILPCCSHLASSGASGLLHVVCTCHGFSSLPVRLRLFTCRARLLVWCSYYKTELSVRSEAPKSICPT